MFKQNFDLKIRCSKQNFDVFKKFKLNKNFYQNFHFPAQFQFLTKTSILDENCNNFDFWAKVRFFFKIFKPHLYKIYFFYFARKYVLSRIE